jgi:hypothetical protein
MDCGGLINLTVLEVGKSKIKVQVDLDSGESLLSGLQIPGSSHGEERECERALVALSLLMRMPIPSWMSPQHTLMTSLNFISSQRSNRQILSHWA